MKTFHVCVLAAVVVAGCSSAEKEAQQAQAYQHNESGLAAAQRNAVVACEPSRCDAAWALTKRYVEQHSDTSVTRADTLAIETDVPYSSGKVSFSATRVDRPGGATLTLFAQCRGMYGPDNAKGSDYDECVEKIVKTQNGYAAFVRGRAGQ